MPTITDQKIAATWVSDCSTISLSGTKRTTVGTRSTGYVILPSALSVVP